MDSPINADRFALSRTAVVTLARRVLACLRDICTHINPKYFMCVFANVSIIQARILSRLCSPWAAYESGATLCIAALLEKRRHPFEETPDFRLIDESVKDSIYLYGELVLRCERSTEILRAGWSIAPPVTVLASR